MSELNKNQIIAFKTADAFESWLEKNQENSEGLWIKIFKKDSGMASITYAEALDIALCYGWIDGQKKAFDEDAWLQRFSARRAKSIWSKINIGHVDRLVKAGKMKAPGLKAIEKAKEEGIWQKAYDSPKNMSIPEDFLKELNKNEKAETFFQTLNKTNLFSIGFRLQTAKKQETREKRMREIIEMLARGEKFH